MKFRYPLVVEETVLEFVHAIKRFVLMCICLSLTML